MRVEPDLSGPPDTAFIDAVSAAADTDAAPRVIALRPSVSTVQRRPAFLAFVLLGGAAFVMFATIAPFDLARGGRSMDSLRLEIFSAAGAIAAALLAAGGLALLALAIRPRRTGDPVAVTAWLVTAVGGFLVLLAPLRFPRPFHHDMPILSGAALIAGAILLAMGIVVAAHRRRAPA